MPFVANRVRLLVQVEGIRPLGGLRDRARCSDCHRSTSIITTPISITTASETSFSLSTSGTR